MTDRLLELANSRWTAPILRSLGLPQPRRLPRRAGASTAQEHAGRDVLILDAPGGFASGAVRTHLLEGGAGLNPSGSLHTLVVDATGVASADALVYLHDTLPGVMGRLRTGARVVLLVSDEPTTPEAAAAVRAIVGFTRSLGKELGRRGATVNCLSLSETGLPGLAAALDFFATDRSAYVSGQALRIGSFSPLSQDQTRQRVAVVTGAAGGIGAVTALRLAADGFRVLCVDIPKAEGALAAIATQAGGTALPLDIAAQDAGGRLVDALGSLGGIDALVHNAGITRDRTLLRMSAHEWDSVLAVNLKAVLAIDEALDEAEIWNVGAREICLASISGIAGNAGQTNYAASKAGLIGYVTARAQVMQAVGVTVNAIAPGFIETSMTGRIPLMVREAGRRLNSLAQGGLPEDVAEAIAFLARPQLQGVTGQTLRVCGQSLLGA